MAYRPAAAMNAHWADAYIGLPYADAGIGDDASAFNCWGLVRYVQRARYGRDLPMILTRPGDLKAAIKDFCTHPVHGAWIVTAAPAEGDVIELSHGLHPHHCGLWIDADSGGVLHAVKGAGVVFDTPGALRLNGWNLLTFWRYNGAACKA